MCENYYIPTIKEKCRRDGLVLLIGNKCDIENKRVIKREEGMELANCIIVYYLKLDA